MKFIENGQFAFYAERILSQKDYYKDYINQKINSEQFYNAMKSDESLANIAGFHEYNFKHISLTPPDDKMPAEKIIGYFIKNNILKSCENMYNGFDEYRKYIHENYNHGENVTFIYPEDERLMYAVAKLTQPKNVFIGGSYYGFLIIWAMKFIKENNGKVVLSDIDSEVCELARENFDKLGFGENTEIYCENAENLLAKRTEPIDMLVLDATGRHDDPRPEYRGKRIYGALLREAKHLLNKDSVIFIHNMEIENPEMKMLVDELKSINAIGENYDTYNGLGVYILC